MVSWNKIQRRNPINGNLRWYPQAVINSTLTTNDIVVGIVEKCTLTKVDVLAVLVALEEVIIEQMKNGNAVRFGSLGSFHPTIKVGKELDPKTGKMVPKSRYVPNDVYDPQTGELDTPGVHTDCIDGIRVIFTKSAEMDKKLDRKNLQFRMVPGETHYPVKG